MDDRTFLLRGGRVLGPNGFEKNASILVENGVIKAAGRVPENQIAPSIPRLNVSGKTVLPGLIDLHVQGAGGRDLVDDDPDAPEAIAEALASMGTTAFLATTVVEMGKKAQSHLEGIARTADGSGGGARILGIHLEGPFINPVKKGMIGECYIEPAGVERLHEIQDYCDGRLRMMTIAPELPGVIPVIDELLDLGIIAVLGHSNATL